MAVQQTSLQAYQQISNTLGAMQEKVLGLYQSMPESTDMEVGRASGLTENQVRPRRNELVKKGFLFHYGTRKCSVTGKTAMTWKVRE